MHKLAVLPTVSITSILRSLVTRNSHSQEPCDNIETGNLKSLTDSDFTTYEYTSKKSAEDKIRVDTRKTINEKLGKDTLYRLKAAP